jgi:hypothetical protein
MTTNVLIDARTDAKLAMFQKPARSLRPASKRASTSATNNVNLHSAPQRQWRTMLPGSSTLSLPIEGRGCLAVSIPHPTITRSNINSALANGEKMIFGKFFKKEGEPASVSTAFPPCHPRQEVRSFARHGYQRTNPWLSRHRQMQNRNSWVGPSPSGQQSEQLSTSPPSSVPITSHLQPAVLRIRPSCSSPKYPPQGRPHSLHVSCSGMDQGVLGDLIGVHKPVGRALTIVDPP